MTRLTRGDGTEGGEDGKGEGGEEGGKEILADGRVNQTKVVQEVLADLKSLKSVLYIFLCIIHN